MQLKQFLFLVQCMRSMPVLHKVIWRMRLTHNRVKRWFLDRRPVIDGCILLHHAILESKPYAAGKMGSTEANAVLDFLKRQRARQSGRTPKGYRPYIFHTLFLNSGVFPQEQECFDLFCDAYLKVVTRCDLLACWDVAGEAEILSRYGKSTILVKQNCLEPHLLQEPWTAALKEKKVLVISPFVDSIRSQYARRDELWANSKLLPSFELLTIRAPFSAGLVKPQDADWFAATARLQAEMDTMDYDVALIGAGAFSLPLAVHAKSRGRIGVHLGGPLQILFGIYGGRWLQYKEYARIINRSWVRPSPEETPGDFQTNENGCYW